MSSDNARACWAVAQATTIIGICKYYIKTMGKTAMMIHLQTWMALKSSRSGSFSELPQIKNNNS